MPDDPRLTLALICTKCGEPSILDIGRENGTVTPQCEECGGKSFTANSFPKQES